MSFPGAGPPPSGVEPDMDNPTDVLRTCNYVTQGLTIVVVTVFVAIRAYSKAKSYGGPLTVEDYATYSSYVLTMGYCITGCFSSVYGGGLNIWEVPKEDIQHFFQTGYAATIFYAPMAMTVKLALVMMIIRVFGAVHRKMRIALYIFVAIVALYYGSGVLIKIFICRPISAYWRNERDKCLDESAIITADAAISAASDLVILLTPTPLTWSLQLPVRKRLRVMGILCAGGIATGFSVYRLGMILSEGDSPNGTIVFIKVILTGNAEIGIGLICACLPAISAHFFAHRHDGSSSSQQQYHRSFRKDLEVGRGEIKMTRTFHVQASPKSEKRGDGGAFDFDKGPGQDEAGLVFDAQANPRSGPSRRSGSGLTE